MGDDWQSIYKFRGAEVAVSQNFTSEFKNSTRLFLSENFRSTRRIVKTGNKVITQSKKFIKKNVKTARPRGEKPRLLLADEDSTIKQAFAAFKKWYKPSESRPLTVLVRTNYVKNLIESLKPDAWQILTIHASKGLEFDNVCVFGVAPGLIPHKWGDPDEEIRILYVATTRARERLYYVGWQQRGQQFKLLEKLARSCHLHYLS